MLNWNDSELARLRQDDILRDAENDRLAGRIGRPRRSIPDPLRSVAPRLVAAAITIGVLVIALR